MLKERIFTVICFVSILFFSSCSSDDGAISVDNLCNEMSVPWCAKIFECKIEELIALLGTEANCKDTFVAECNKETSPIKVSIDAGKVIYHADVAEKCINVIKNATCDQLNNIEGKLKPSKFSECNNFYSGSIKDGDSCTIDEECISTTCEDGKCVKEQ